MDGVRLVPTTLRRHDTVGRVSTEQVLKKGSTQRKMVDVGQTVPQTFARHYKHISFLTLLDFAEEAH